MAAGGVSEITAKPLSEVADSTNGLSPQPMRAPVRVRVADILEQADRRVKSGYPVDFTHRELAGLVYATDEPTAAQESAIRRAVAALVAAERAERLTGDRMGTRYDAGRGRSGRHLRMNREGEMYEATNPAGIAVRRVLTADDREARATVAEQHGHIEYAARIRQGDAV